MSCRDGCDPWCGTPPAGWEGPSIGEPDWFRPTDRRVSRRVESTSALETPPLGELEARLDVLQAELRQIARLIADQR